MSRCTLAILTLLLASSLAAPASAAGSHRVATGFDHPVFLTSPPGDPRLFVVEQTGLIRIIANAASGNVLATPFLDLTDRIQIFSFVEEERGLLGLAFPPDYAKSGLFYVQYTETPFFPEPGNVVVARFQVSGDANVANPASEQLIFKMAKPSPQDPSQPEAYHNGGTIAFAGGELWMATGDGGGYFGNDLNNCSQNAGSPLGKLLRIDLALVPQGGITVPSGAACPQLPVTTAIEIWARGLRNPYRFSFDRSTGDLYIGDVGQDAREELDVLAASSFSAAGPNFGWRAWEGSIQNPENCPGDALCNQAGQVEFPVHDYAHTVGDCGTGGGGSVIAGYVYRGANPAYQGHYFFADLCQGFIKSFVWDGANGITSLTDRTAELAPDAGTIDVVTGFGEDGSGELYFVDWLDGEVFRVPEPRGEILAIAALVAAAAIARHRSGSPSGMFEVAASPPSTSKILPVTKLEAGDAR